MSALHSQTLACPGLLDDVLMSFLLQAWCENLSTDNFWYALHRGWHSCPQTDQSDTRGPGHASLKGNHNIIASARIKPSKKPPKTPSLKQYIKDACLPPCKSNERGQNQNPPKAAAKVELEIEQTKIVRTCGKKTELSNGKVEMILNRRPGASLPFSSRPIQPVNRLWHMKHKSVLSFLGSFPKTNCNGRHSKPRPSEEQSPCVHGKLLAPRV